MYSLSQLKRGIESPNLFFREVNRLYHRRLNLRMYNTSGVDIFSEDWDNLILMDACRYDMFEEKSDLPGRLESRISRGSATTEFLKANFHNKDLYDTVYVTANPQLYRNQNKIDVNLHAVVDVWKQEGWHEKLGTVLPETLTEHAMNAEKVFKDKRLVVHYIQPHYPFIATETEFDKDHLQQEHPNQPNLWSRIMEGDLHVSKEEIWDAYLANLEAVLPHVLNLMVKLPGKSIVTSDHGNMLGERARPIPVKEWGHPRGIYTEELVKVPWLVYDKKPRKKIVAEGPTKNSEKVDDEVVEDRLKSLGYVN